jgi:serine/threonine-protein kinase
LASGSKEIEARLGTVVAGKYRLVKCVGTGGMGAVFEAEHTLIKRRVALKLMLTHSSQSVDAVARFLREAEAAARINHPNIVAVLDAGHDERDGTLYLVQELLTGTDLRRVLARRPLDLHEAFATLVPVAHALASAHRHGVVHRDVKPENIFLATVRTGGAVPKLIDFGVSKIVTNSDAGDSRLTRSGALLGTPHYMSPEQARGDRVIDALTDVWAMGVVLFEVLSGRAPFDAKNYNALIMSILNDPVPRLDAVAPGIPRQLADVVAAALARDRDERFDSMDALLDALLACPALASEGWHAALATAYGDSPAAIAERIVGVTAALARSADLALPTSVETTEPAAAMACANDVDAAPPRADEPTAPNAVPPPPAVLEGAPPVPPTRDPGPSLAGAPLSSPIPHSAGEPHPTPLIWDDTELRRPR